MPAIDVAMEKFGELVAANGYVQRECEEIPAGDVRLEKEGSPVAARSEGMKFAFGGELEEGR